MRGGGGAIPSREGGGKRDRKEERFGGKETEKG